MDGSVHIFKAFIGGSVNRWKVKELRQATCTGSEEIVNRDVEFIGQRHRRRAKKVDDEDGDFRGLRNGL